MSRIRWVLILSTLLFSSSSAVGQPLTDRARATAAFKQGEALSEQGKPREAVPFLETAATLAPRVYGPDTATTAAVLSALAGAYADTGQFAAAEPLFQRALTIMGARLGPDHVAVAELAGTLALVYEELGRLTEAEPLFQRSLKIYEASNGPDDPWVAEILTNLGGLYSKLGQFDRAEPLLRRSLTIREKRFGATHAETAASRVNLANLYRETGRYAEAQPLLEQSLKTLETQRGPDDPDVATALNTLALVSFENGRRDEAKGLYLRSLKILESKLGPDHPLVAVVLNNLASLEKGAGNFEEAEARYQRSLQIREAKFGPDHPDVAHTLGDLGALNAALDRWPEAASAFDRARRILRRHVDRVLPALSEAEQLQFLKVRERYSYQVSLSVGLARRADANVNTLSAGWVLNGKGLARQALAERALLARDGHDPGAAGVVADLERVRTQLASLTFASPTKNDPREGRRSELDRLAAKEQELARQLGQRVGRVARADPWVEVDEVRRSLATDAVLIEFARFEVFDYQAPRNERKWQPARYVAWVIPAAGQGEIQVFDLGPAERIDAAVAAVRLTLGSDAFDTSGGERAAMQRTRGALAELARLALEPMLPVIGGKVRWIFSPDAALWLVPWAALPIGDGRFAVEDHEISYMISGRDVVRNRPRHPGGQALIMADPDFDLDANGVSRATRAVLRGGVTAAPERATRGLTRLLKLDAVPRLPGTAAEAKAVAPKLRTFTGVDPIVYTGQWALEPVFKAFRQPRVVVLATHGFFLEDRPASPTPKAPDAASPENPLLRCGLLLAGCRGGETGVLTGLEIVGTDLRGTELVVLSACETGLGQIQFGEGVAGLRQAFQLAGAEAVVATLWQVPDEETSQLMAAFFDRLAAGSTKAAALRQAQQKTIDARRQRVGAAHPYYWAAFTVTEGSR